MNGPVPIGCWVPKVPVGWKTPFESTEPWSAPYFCSAVGLAIENDASDSAARNDADGLVSRSLTWYLPTVLQPAYRLLVGLPGSGLAKPPKTVCQ